jgi:hypothetical protein
MRALIPSRLQSKQLCQMSYSALNGATYRYVLAAVEIRV